MTEKSGVSKDIQAFVQQHMDGWNHDEWMGFIHHLGEAGHDVSDLDGIGLALEQERLRCTLKTWGIKGLGPKRIEAITHSYASLENMRGTDGPGIADRTGLPKQIANEVAARLF